MDAEEIRKQIRYEQALGAIQEMFAENRKLRVEIEELKPLAPLATLMSVMEGFCLKQHRELLSRDADSEVLRGDYQKLLSRVDHLAALVDELWADRHGRPTGDGGSPPAPRRNSGGSPPSGRRG